MLKCKIWWKISPIVAIENSFSLKANFTPFNRLSILHSLDPNSHSCIHNSVTLPFWTKWILVTFPYTFLSILFHCQSPVTKCSYLTYSNQIFCAEFWMSTLTAIVVSQVSHVSDSFVLHLSDLMEFSKKLLRNSSLWIKGSFCYEFIFNLQIYYVMCLFIVLIHNISNKTYYFW